MKHPKTPAPRPHAPYSPNPPPQPLPLRKGEGRNAPARLGRDNPPSPSPSPLPKGGGEEGAGPIAARSPSPLPYEGRGVRGVGFTAQAVAPRPHAPARLGRDNPPSPSPSPLPKGGGEEAVSHTAARSPSPLPYKGREARGVGFAALAIAPRPHASYPHNPPPRPLPLRAGEGLSVPSALRGGQIPPPLRGEGVRGWGLGLLPVVLTGWWPGAAWLLLGALAGLGLSALADVLPHGPRAARRCPRCGMQRSWPAYAFNLRPCPGCGWRPWRPWVLIALTAGLTVFLRFTPTRLPFAWLWPLTLGFLLIAVIDWEHHLILPEVLAVVGLYGLVLGVVRRGWGSTLLGVAAGGLIMLALYALGRWLQPRLGAAEEPLGFGDVLLMLVLGAVLGWPGVLAGWVWGVLLAGAYSVVLLAVCALRGRGWAGGVFLPYAPFLLLAAWGLLVGW